MRSSPLAVNVEFRLVCAQTQLEDSSFWTEPSTVRSPKRRTDAKPPEHLQQPGATDESRENPTHSLTLRPERN
jgi:hypothetical protein